MKRALQRLIGESEKKSPILTSQIIAQNPQKPATKSATSLLHWAAKESHKNLCLTLIEKGAKGDIKDAHGKTAFEVLGEESEEAKKFAGELSQKVLVTALQSLKDDLSALKAQLGALAQVLQTLKTKL